MLIRNLHTLKNKTVTRAVSQECFRCSSAENTLNS